MLLARRCFCSSHHYTTTMQQPPKTVSTVTRGCLTLHNVIRKRMPLQADEVDIVDEQGNVVQKGAWHQNVELFEEDPGELLEKSTQQYRDSLAKRSSCYWT